jgi:hypothetical protein
MSIIQMATQTIVRGVRSMTNISTKQKERDTHDNKKTKDYPKTPSGFQCFVCGKRFATDEERIYHLEKEPHGSMYDTGSPQEREDARRSRKIS